MLHIFSSRLPSQKLSKPVPTSGLAVIPRTRRQISVRPVRVDSLPTVPTSPPEVSKKTANEETESTPITRRWMKTGILTTQRRLVITSVRLAKMKHDMEVAELTTARSQTTIVNRVH